MERAEMTKICDDFKIRASGGGNIMGIKGLGKTGETYLKKWLKEQLYNRREEIKSKYITKGHQCEEDAFTLLCCELNIGMIYKNIEFFKNDYTCGTPDIITSNTIYDTKNSWSLETFPMFEKDVPNTDYWWQLQIYMYLTNRKKAVLAYALI